MNDDATRPNADERFGVSGIECRDAGVIVDPLVANNRQALEHLCAHKVRRLELFGSATTADGVTASNDLDFLIEFEDIPPGDYTEAYFGLLDLLTALFEKPVDLVAISSVSNPYFLRSIERTRTLLYAA